MTMEDLTPIRLLPSLHLTRLPLTHPQNPTQAATHPNLIRLPLTALLLIRLPLTALLLTCPTTAATTTTTWVTPAAATRTRGQTPRGKAPRWRTPWEGHHFEENRDILLGEGVTAIPTDPNTHADEETTRQLLADFGDRDGFDSEAAKDALDAALADYQQENPDYEPGAEIPREVLAEMMCGGLGCTGSTPEDQINELYDLGITVGTRPNDGTQADRVDAFAPDADSTNGHLVAFFSRVEEIYGSGNNGGGNNGGGNNGGGNNGGGNNGGGNNGGGNNGGGNPPINTPLPTITVSGPSSGVSEASSNVGFTVQLSHRYPRNVYVTVETVDGTAAAGSDYNLLYGRLTIRANNLSASVTPTLIDDSISEPDETFSLRISNPTSAVLGSMTEATATILDNEAPQPGMVSNLAVDCSTVGDSGELTVSWSAPLTGATPTGYELQLPDPDDPYNSFAPTRIVTAGTWEATITGITEGWREYRAQVVAFLPGTGGGPPAVLDVDCQEPPPTVSFSTTTFAINEGDTVDITAMLDKAAVGTATVDLVPTGAVGGGTSCATGDDFSLSAQSFTFTNTDTATVTLTACADANSDNATVTMTLTTVGISGLQVGTPADAVVTITDTTPPADNFGYGL